MEKEKPMSVVPDHDYGNALVALYSHAYFLQIIEPWQPDPQFWKFPGGGIEKGETPEEAAVREVFEETGVRIRASELVLRAVIERPGRTGGAYKRHFFTAKIADRRIRKHAQRGNEGEVVRLVRFSGRHADLYPPHRELLDQIPLPVLLEPKTA